jgi:hypothetical protein
VIDFRYHLVSLISVFLALAVGIVLGAGPLKETIGDTLTGEVDALRSRAADLRTELDGTQADLAVSQEVFAAVAPDLLDGVMSQRRIAVLTVGDVDLSVVEAVVGRLGQAGAQVTATVGITEAWTDPARRSYRQSLAGTLIDYLDPVPEQSAGTAVELAEALAQSLTTADPADPGAFTEEARVVLGVLAEAGLVSFEGEVTVPADGIVVLVEPAVVEPPSDPGTAEPVDPDVVAHREAVVVTGVQIATAAQLRSRGAVVASGTVVEGGLFDRLRDTTRLVRISTVESSDSVVGQVSVVLALGARMSGTVGHFGPSASATDLVPPRVVLPLIDRTPRVPDGDDAEGGAAGDDAEGGAAGDDAEGQTG